MALIPPAAAPAGLPPDARAQQTKVVSTRVTTEPLWVRLLLTTAALVFLLLFLFVPLWIVFSEAFAKGFAEFSKAVTDSDALASVKLTLLVAAIAVPLNTVFGIAAAWCIAKFRFVGRSLLLSLIDLPFAISPVISGLVFVLLFGRLGVFGPWLEAHNIRIIFAAPGIVLATTFVTFPFVARELIAFMEAQGSEEEEAAMVLGASGWQTFFRVTLPNVRWGLIYGIILCNARAMGEFGAVSVVSDKIAGQTNTIPLQVEYLYDSYDFTAAFAVASLLTVLGIVTLVIKQVVEYKTHRELAQGGKAVLES